MACVSGSDCWAVGAVLAVGGGNPSGTLIENWNGSSWSIVPSPNPTAPGVVGAVLQGVSCTSASNCMAVGFATDDDGENLNDVIEQWNGTAWSIVPGADTGQPFDQLSTIDCLAADDCWAVGNAGPAQQNPNFLPIFPGAVGDQGLIEHWDGATWSVTPSAAEPSPNGGYLYGLTCVDAADCWASGATTDDTGDASGLLLQHWDGSTWTDMSASVPDSSSPRHAEQPLLRQLGAVLGGRLAGDLRWRRWRQLPAEEFHRELERQLLVRRAEPGRGRAQLPGLGLLRAIRRLPRGRQRSHLGSGTTTTRDSGLSSSR